MINTASNFETLKQRMATSPQDSFFKGKLSRVYEVLIVDDEEPFVLSLADGLSTYKKYFHVRTAPNGAEAVKILKLSPVDLVITDLSMPKMDGFELLAYMNRNYPKIPVILMTAYGTPKIEEIVSNMGIFRYLEKPLDINSVADNIVDALGIKISITETKTQTFDNVDTSYRSADIQSKIAATKKSAEINISDAEDKSKTTATFGSRTSIDIEKIKDEARLKAAGKVKELSDKKSAPDAEKRAIEAAEKRLILEAKAKAEAERFAREEAERKAQEAEEKARQESLAREEAERKARDAEERAEKAKQEALAREEVIKKAKADVEEKARQEALAREEAIKKAKAEAEAEEKARREALAREEAKRKARDAEEKARQEALAKEEALKKEKAEAEARRETLAREEAERKAKEAEEKARQEALAKEEALKKEKAEAEEISRKEAQAQAENDKKQKDLKSETQQKLSAWKKS